ncbi:autotransporter assembly complex protein TamA [Halovulum sp. GXIMD14794]
MNYRAGTRSALVLILIAATGIPMPASAFEIFGVRLWGEPKEEQPDDIGILDPRPYSVDFSVGMAASGVDSTLRQASALWVNRDLPASGAAGLISTAQEDYRAILAALYSEGYYSGAIGIRINGREVTGLSLGSQLSDPIRVQVSVDPGPRYRFGRTDFINEPPRPANIDLSENEVLARERFQTGEIAYAEIALDAGDRAIQDWRMAGYPTADVGERTVVADHDRDILDVTIRMDPGPRANFGQVTVQNRGAVDAEFIRYMSGIRPGEPFSPDDIERASDRLNELGVFNVVRITEAEQVSPDGTLPITVETAPRKPRRVGVGATFSSIDGLGLEGYWLHRNLFGRAERLRFDASIGGLIEESDFEDMDYLLGGTFTKPGVFSPDNDMILGLTAEQENFSDRLERSVTGQFGFSRWFNDRLTGSAFLELRYSFVDDDQGEREFYTIGAPVSLVYDYRNDELDPTRGYYIAGQVKPFVELEFDSVAVRTAIEGRKYFPFNEGKTVLATRLGYGTVLGGDLLDLPPSELFFTGGGGSVRGYEYQSNGINVDGNEVGGRSALEGSLEIRQRFLDTYGVVGFVDAGLVSADEFPSNETDLKVGVGLGARYYTGLGPLRLDIAAPLDRDEGDSSVAFYVGIGQAF